MNEQVECPIVFQNTDGLGCVTPENIELWYMLAVLPQSCVLCGEDSLSFPEIHPSSQNGSD